MLLRKLNVLFFLIMGCVTTYAVIMNFSVVESRYKCSDHIKTQEGVSPIDVYIKLGRYRWWTSLWGESDGFLYLEVPNTFVTYYGRLEELGEQIQVMDERDGSLRGNLSLLSRTLALKVPSGFIDAVCSENY